MLNYNAQCDDCIVELERMVAHQSTMIASLCGRLGMLEDVLHRVQEVPPRPLSGLVSGALSITIYSPISHILCPASVDKPRFVSLTSPLTVLVQSTRPLRTWPRACHGHVHARRGSNPRVFHYFGLGTGWTRVNPCDPSRAALGWLIDTQ